MRLVTSANTRYLEQWGKTWARSAVDVGYEPLIIVPRNVDPKLTRTFGAVDILPIDHGEDPWNHWTWHRFREAAKLERDGPIVMTDIDTVFTHLWEPPGHAWDVGIMHWGLNLDNPVHWAGEFLKRGYSFLQCRAAEVLIAEFVAVNHTEEGRAWLNAAADCIDEGVKSGASEFWGFDQLALAHAYLTTPHRLIKLESGGVHKKMGYVSSWAPEKPNETYKAVAERYQLM